MTALRIRHLKENVAVVLCALGTLFATGMLFLIIGDIFIGAIPSLSLHFLITPENKASIGGGIANAIVGTILLSLLATVLAVPCAIGTAIYLKRYARESRVTHTIRFMIEVLSGTPSIVVGMFGLLVLVIYLKQVTGGFSLIAGVICLAILVIPVIERAVESAIDTVSPDLEEGSYALGATKWQTLKMVTLPAAVNGIMTSIILGFGRAAEESSVIVLTAGYSQYIPALGIDHNSKFLSGLQIHPFNDPIASLPYAVYMSYENTNIIPMSNAYAIAFVLITFVLLVNVIAKIVCSRTIGGNGGGKNGSFPAWLEAFAAKFQQNGAASKATNSSFWKISQTFRKISLFRKATQNPENTGASTQGLGSFSSQEPATAVISPQQSPEPYHQDDKRPETERGLQAFPLIDGTNHPRLSFRQRITLVDASIRRWFLGRLHHSTKPAGFRSEGKLHDKEMPTKSRNAFGKVFLLSLTPFALIAVILIVLSLVLPRFGTGLSAGSGTFIALLIVTIVAGTVCTFAALFLRRLLLRTMRKKYRLPVSRAGTTAALGAGICIVFACAFLFSAHAVLPDSGPAGLANPLSLFGLGNSTTQEPVNRSAQLAALLAEEGDDGTGSTLPAAASTAAPVAATAAVTPTAAAITPSVPLKDALSLREIYQYGNPDRRCLATVYNTTVLPFYFWWLIDYNRFVPETPAPGNKFIVVFVRIEDDGSKSAIVPSADAITVTYKGTTYTHEPYFNTSYLSDWQIDYYESHLDKLPYQWIREIGPMKRDYAYLTGYNIFWENLTTTDNETTVYQPDFDINGKGFFIQPGSSNAIDGYLIYEVPDAVASDLKNAYVQIAFNSISSTRWRLGT